MVKSEIERLTLTIGGVQITGFTSNDIVYVGPEKCRRCRDTGVVSMFRVARDSSGKAITSESGEPHLIYSHTEQCGCGHTPAMEISVNDESEG
jgi:hypothetical protein